MTNHENAFRGMKQIVDDSEMLKPLNLKSIELSIYIIIDVSLVDSSEYIAQEMILKTTRFVIYHSRVFNLTQINYSMHE